MRVKFYGIIRSWLFQASWANGQAVWAVSDDSWVCSHVCAPFALCEKVVQFVAVCCSVLQCVAVCVLHMRRVERLQHTTTHCNTCVLRMRHAQRDPLQCVAMCCNVLQCVCSVCVVSKEA